MSYSEKEDQCNDRDSERVIALFQQTELMTGVGGWGLDLESGELYWSDQVYRIHELPIGSKIDVASAIDYYDGEARILIANAVSELSTSGKPYDLELPFITAKGRKIMVRACGKPVYEAGRIVRILGAFQDITVEKERERGYQDLANKAEEAAKAKGQFLANISHEIRTPLNGVLGMTELLLETDLKEDQLEFARNIQSSAAHLLTTIEDILQFSRIEANKTTLNMGLGKLREFLEEIPLVFSRAIQERNIVYVEAFDPILTSLNFDHSKLRQVLINILGNAFKFTENGGAIVHQARIDRETEDDVTIKFIVTDTGPGIKESEWERIFQPFYQVDNSSTREFDGTGLGLAISHELVGLMGGELKVKSRVDCGACFYFTLTLKKAETGQLDLEDEQVISSSLLRGKSLSPLNILVAEDVKVNQRILGILLERRGHRLTFADDGLEALDLYKKFDFDVILLDIQMPKLSGDQVAASIRQSEIGTHKHIPIVACTAHAMPGDSEIYLKMGMDAYLSKPVRGAELIQVVESVVAYGKENEKEKE